VKAPMLDIWNEVRIENAQKYIEGLSALEKLGKIILPKIKENETHTFHQFTIEAEKRDVLRKFLEEKGIPTALYYKTLMNDQPVLDAKNIPYRISEDLKKSEQLTETVLSLPIAPHLTEKQIQYIIQSISDFYQTK
jgi:dTDP-4-amino-4,6-dideoxygalactose transaminase